MSEKQPDRPLRVLIVEDSETDAELLLRELKRGGFDITCERVQTTSEMRRALTDRVWDIILSDYSMPSFDAPRALSLLKELGHDVPFIVVSGTIDEESAVESLRSGAHDFLTKGRLARLLPAVERELREAKVRESRRATERSLRESEQRYRRIIETTSQGVWMLDAAARTTFVNARMANLLGCTVDEACGAPLQQFIPQPSRTAVVAQLQQSDPNLQLEATLQRPDGTRSSVLLATTPVLDAGGEPEGTLVMVTDVTARKQLEEQLRQAQKMEAIGSLAGGVAHDFNNLLSVILSCSTLILDGLPANDPIRIDLEEVRKAGERAADLTRQMLAFSRRQVFELKILDLNQLLEGMGALLRRLLPEHIELALRAGFDLGRVRADRGQMEQVVMNLVVNARDAMPSGGRIVLTTGSAVIDDDSQASPLGTSPGRYVTLAVTDNGVGMDAATKARIFEPFFTTKEQGKGTGLGLATAFGIIRQSGGQISVESEPGVGTTFKIHLPEAKGAPDSLETSEPQSPPAACVETILLVEDEEAVRNVAHAILRRQGYTVLDAQNGGEALLVCEKYPAPIELLVTDVIMPHMTGRELTVRLAPLRPDMKVLYVSGYTEDSVIHDGVLEPGIAFLQKPITPVTFLRKVREVLDAPGRLQAHG
jgi:two-component system, cell cycle sensor histidine kinase and response regulator CckA